TLDFSDVFFILCRYVFAKGSGAPAAEVTNAWELIGDGFVVLMGDRVANEGLVQARLGTVALAAGEKISLQLDGSGLVSFAVDEATAAAQAGVENTGEIVANGGRVLMTAKVANELVATAVNNAGVVRAVDIAEDGGEIYLRGPGGSDVNSGTRAARGALGGRGGRVVVASAPDDVEIAAGAVVKATGEGTADGGTVRLVAQRSLDVAAGATVDARGGANGGQGGFVEVSAHTGALKLDGEIEAGAGGEILIDPARLGIGPGAASPSGNATLATVGKGFIESKLNSNTDVTLVAENEIFATGGPFTIAATGTGNLALRIGQISGTGSASLGVGLSTGSFGFSTDPAGDINLAGIAISIQGLFTASAGSSAGNVTLGALGAAGVTINGANSGLTNGNVLTGAISAPTGTVQIEAGATGGNVTTGPINARTLLVNTLNGTGVNTGNVNITGIAATQSVNVNAGTAGGNLNVGAVSVTAAGQDADLILDAVGGNLNVGGPISVVATGANADAFASLGGKVVNVNGNITVSAGGGGSSAELFVDAQNGINLNGNLSVSGAGESGGIFLDNSGVGNINVNGNVTVSGGSFGSISFETDDGNINVSGNLAATGGSAWIGLFADDGRINLAGGARATAQASYGSADITFEAGRGILVTGAIEAQASDSARINIFNAFYGGSSGDLILQNTVSATSKSERAQVHIFNPGNGAVRLNGAVSVLGPGGGRGVSQLLVMGGAGGIVTGPSGLLDAPMMSLSTVQGGAVIVRTKSPEIAIANYGGGSPDVAIDNTAHAGPTLLHPNLVSNYGGGDGSYGGSFAQQSSFGGFGAFKLSAAGDVVVSGSMFAQNALIDVSGGSLAIKGTMFVGERNLPNEFGDRVSLLFLSRALRADGGRIALPRYNGAVTTGPNAIFRAQNGIEIAEGLVFLDPDTPYVVFMTDGTLALGPGVFSESSIGNEFLAQFSSYSPKATIHVENSTPLLPFGDGPTFTNHDHFSKLPGTTMIIGNLGLPGLPHVGGITIGRNGKIDIGDQNILFSTAGTTTGIGNIVSTGFIGEVVTRDLLQRVFQTPIVNEFDDVDENGKKRARDYVRIEEGSGDGDQQLVAQKSNNGQMCE
ncbi:MAG: beta strand repeat-containing protein, partial [Gammaproteobacteria bacterium]